MQPRTILVVEDEAPIAAAVAVCLRSEGFRVEIAHSGPDGVEACRRLRPALVVLDLMLPGLDGLEVLRRIQDEQPVPVLMLTARDSETDLLVGLGLGADDYVTKPFSPASWSPASTRSCAASSAPRPRLARPSASATSSWTRPPTAPAAAATPSTSLRPSSTCSTSLPSGPAWCSRESSSWPRSGAGQAAPARARSTLHVQALRRKLGAGVVRTVHGVGYAAPEGAQ